MYFFSLSLPSSIDEGIYVYNIVIVGRAFRGGFHV